MVGPVIEANATRELSHGQNRPSQQQPPATTPGALDPSTNLPPDKRVTALQDAVERLIRSALPSNARLSIEQDKEAGTFIYRSVDPRSGEVLQQWPVEEFVRLREALRDMEGMLVDVKA